MEVLEHLDVGNLTVRCKESLCSKPKTHLLLSSKILETMAAALDIKPSNRKKKPDHFNRRILDFTPSRPSLTASIPD